LKTPGLSVLIPLFNRAALPLVQALLAQVHGWGGPVEIWCLDDGSQAHIKDQNRALTALKGVQYEELPCNIGRAAIRNELARRARYPWLLLLDNDSLLPDDQFLARYAAARTLAPVVAGSTAGSAKPVPPPCANAPRMAS
jgi:glycosyltransferase involved in cell wall biosynthesis